MIDWSSAKTLGFIFVATVEDIQNGIVNGIPISYNVLQRFESILLGKFDVLHF